MPCVVFTSINEYIILLQEWFLWVGARGGGGRSWLVGIQYSIVYRRSIKTQSATDFSLRAEAIELDFHIKRTTEQTLKFSSIVWWFYASKHKITMYTISEWK